MNATSAIVDELYPLVAKSLSSNLNGYKSNIANFLSARSKDLYDIAPYTRLYFSEEDVKKHFAVMQYTVSDAENIISKTYFSKIEKFNPRCAKDPLTISALMCVRYFFIKKMQKELELSMMYLAFSGKIYSSLHFSSFPTVQPSEYRYVMEYVINNMMSNKFDLKIAGSLIGAVKSICNTWINSYAEKLTDSDDEDIVYVLQQLHSRVGSMIKNCADLYYDAYKSKDKWLTMDSDSSEEDSYRIADNDSLKADRFVLSAMNYVTSFGVNFKFCKDVADVNIREMEIKNIIESIQHDNNNLALLREYMGIMITEYLISAKVKEVTSIDFLTFCASPKPNTKNVNIIRARSIIEGFLSENSTQYIKRRSRLATSNSYHRAINLYYALVINHSNK